MRKLYQHKVKKVWVINPVTGTRIKRETIEKPEEPKRHYYTTKPNLMSSPDYVHSKKIPMRKLNGHGIWKPTTRDAPKGMLR